MAAVWGLALPLALAGCEAGDGGGSHDVGAPGLGDPYFPKAGNGGYDVRHYDLDLAYDPTGHRLSGTARVTARATEALSAFHLDLKGMTVEKVTVEGSAATFDRDGQELVREPPRPGREAR